ncbi:hypothetical protein FQZ97_1213270 [compost metagenome]
MGSAVLEFFNEQGYKPSVTILGIPDEIVEHGKPEELHHLCGYDKEAIVAAAKNFSSVITETVSIGV